MDVSLELVADRRRIVSIVAFDRGDTGIKLIGDAPNADPARRSGPEHGGSSFSRAAGRVGGRVARTYSLAEAADAHRFLEEGHPGGKVVLRP